MWREAAPKHCALVLLDNIGDGGYIKVITTTHCQLVGILPRVVSLKKPSIEQCTPRHRLFERESEQNALAPHRIFNPQQNCLMAEPGAQLTRFFLFTLYLMERASEWVGAPVPNGGDDDDDDDRTRESIEDESKSQQGNAARRRFCSSTPTSLSKLVIKNLRSSVHTIPTTPFDSLSLSLSFISLSLSFPPLFHRSRQTNWCRRQIACHEWCVFVG